MIYFCFFSLFIFIEVIYLKIARQVGLIDVPNHRSSHLNSTVRGGGVIFPIAFLLSYFTSTNHFTLLLIAVLMLSTISLLDDKYSLPSILRFTVQFIASVFLILQLELPLIHWSFPIVLFVLIGGVNAFNFMDGVNGITALYSIVTLSTLWVVNTQVSFIEANYILFPLMSVLAFSLFNVRKRALCFAGDVGSISIAAIILFLLFKLVIHTQDYFYLLLLLVYALDSGVTILKRKFRRENIFKPHREHLYQQLVHKRGWAHLHVSLLFAIVQLLINSSVLFERSIFWIMFTVLLVMISYIFALNHIQKSEK